MWTKKQRSSSRNFTKWVKTKKKVFISKYARNLTNFEVKGKKALQFKKCANFHEFRGETTKKRGLNYKICEKTVLAHEFRGDNQYLGSLRPRTALQWQQVCYFLWGTILAWGHNSRLGGHKQWHGPGLLPVASGLLKAYSNLSNCNYLIFVKEILLEIGFIEKMKTI